MSAKRAVSVFACVAVALGLPGLVGTASAAPPSNDSIGGATVVRSLPYSATLDTTQATTDADDVPENCGFNATNSVWYVYTAVANETELTVDATRSNYPVYVHISTGAPGALSTLSCGSAVARIAATPGTTYYIRLYGLGRGGALHLSIRGPGPAPSNDAIGKAIKISHVPFKSTKDTTGATSDFVDTQVLSHCGLLPARTVWYKFTGGRKHEFSFDASGSDYATEVIVATANAGILTTVACDGGLTSAALLPHRTYYVGISDIGSGLGGTLRFHVTQSPSVRVHVQRLVELDGKGDLHLKGTYRCIQVRNLEIDVHIYQIVPAGVAEADFTIAIAAPTCNNGPHLWTRTTAPETATDFDLGRAAIDSSASGCGLFCVSVNHRGAIVQLINHAPATHAVAPALHHTTRLDAAPARRS